MATKRKAVRRAEAPTTKNEPKFGIQLVTGATYSVDNMRFVRGHCYKVSRELRDKLVGSRYFADARPDPGKQALDPGRLRPGATGQGQMTAAQRVMLAQQRKEEQLRKRANSIPLDDQAGISDRIDPNTHLDDLIGDDLEMDFSIPDGPVSLTDDGVAADRPAEPVPLKE